MYRFRKKDQISRRNAVRRILVERLEDRKLMAGDVMSSIMGAGYFSFGVSASETPEVVDSYTVDLDNLPEGTVVGKAVLPFGKIEGAFEFASVVDLSSLMRSSVNEEVVDSYTIDLENLPEGTVVGESVVPTPLLEGAIEVGSAVDLSELLRSSVNEEVVDSYTIDLDNLPEGTVVGESVVPAELFEGAIEVGSAVDLSELLRSSMNEEVVDSYTVDLDNLPEGTVVGETVVPTALFGGAIEVGSAVDLSGLLRSSMNEEVVDSYTVDPKNLPEGTVIGEAIAGQFDWSSEVVDSYTIDLENLPEGTVIGEAIAGQFDWSSEVVDSFTVDPKNLPEGTVIGEAVAGQFDWSSEVVDSFTVDPKNLPEGTAFGVSVSEDNANGNRKDVSQGQATANSGHGKSKQVDLGLIHFGKRGRFLKDQLVDTALSGLMFE